MANGLLVKNLAPVLILGGEANALSLMRSFGKQGIESRVCMPENPVMRSRFCTESFPIPAGSDSQSFFHELLLGGSFPELHGSVIFACGDDAVEYLAKNRHLLTKDYLLERNNPKLQLALLNKQSTLELARQAKVPVPTFWNVQAAEDVEAALDGAIYPAMLKPHLSHIFQRKFGRKYRLANDSGELRNLCEEMLEADVSFMICEMIPGADDQLCSYYTYRDENGRELLHFTKRCLRRLPMNEGCGTYQITEHLPDVEEMARRFFDSVDFRGLGNLEFKRDCRDGQLKVMECNTRFTAVQEQLVQSGVDAALIAYSHITDQQVEPVSGCKQFVAIWLPFKDLMAFREAKSVLSLNWLDWFKSLHHRKLVLPYFDLKDLRPSVSLLTQQITYLARRLVTKLIKRPGLMRPVSKA